MKNKKLFWSGLFFFSLIVLLLLLYLTLSKTSQVFTPANFRGQDVTFEPVLDETTQTIKISAVVVKDFKIGDSNLEIASSPSQYLIASKKVPLDFIQLLFLVQETKDQNIHFWKGLEPSEVTPYLTKGTQITMEYHSIDTKNPPSTSKLLGTSPTHIVIHNYLKSQ